MSFRGFGDGVSNEVSAATPARGAHSDLTSALRDALAQAEERPARSSS
ncbi:MAG: hypothetical protein U0165_14115 [Polyangiaceae bacterium]